MLKQGKVPLVSLFLLTSKTHLRRTSILDPCLILSENKVQGQVGKSELKGRKTLKASKANQQQHITHYYTIVKNSDI